VSTAKKSHASRPSAWARRKVRQEVSRPRGAGRQRRARRIRCTIASLIWRPGRLSSPYPGGIPRPVVPCQPQHQVADFGPRAGDRTAVPGQQRPGVTSRLPRSAGGSSRARAARIALPAQSGPGRAYLAAEHHHLMPQHLDLGVPWTPGYGPARPASQDSSETVQGARQGRPARETLTATRAGIRAALLSRQRWWGQECRGVRKLVDELCKYPGCGAMSGDVPGAALAGPAG